MLLGVDKVVMAALHFLNGRTYHSH